MMTIEPFYDVSHDTAQTFFTDETKPKTDWEQQYGYLLFVDDVAIAFFVLYPMSVEAVWLRRLWLHEQANPALLMMMFDWISDYAKTQSYNDLYTHLDDPTKHVLLEMNHFHLAEEVPTAFEGTKGQCYVKSLSTHATS
ncbi:hypothetical protein ABID56_002279 [Alkalibacillus flavidus]|uniref:Uncharacterized protein n=1 Tax=Alkalibacillus flavidus TaxID=546021 RepID=A0ABV2KX40_9BACI